jgi:hypothetical protein
MPTDSVPIVSIDVSAKGNAKPGSPASRLVHRLFGFVTGQPE